ncbi:hypothetical protein MSG28_001127 [Choristoneura fumiferana]|uniref:Uncharacterized protein n=1 Tax=Choristoneura fumiferana TaxID=7141 RepID=A0ACC0K3K9_CHOFU|nr:hypothetical protein MSG28_001127 [Choristoneura fumiferana]
MAETWHLEVGSLLGLLLGLLSRAEVQLVGVPAAEDLILDAAQLVHYQLHALQVFPEHAEPHEDKAVLRAEGRAVHEGSPGCDAVGVKVGLLRSLWGQVRTLSQKLGADASHFLNLFPCLLGGTETTRTLLVHFSPSSVVKIKKSKLEPAGMAEMRTFCFVNYYRKLLKNVQLRRFCTAETDSKANIEKIRNIGILAHIDAVDIYRQDNDNRAHAVLLGNDPLDGRGAPRQHAAAVSFPWHGNQINLIDTPGHIDFTMEVEQSLAVLDGAVVVLDASAGVEAQTLTVWRQASGHRVPRLLYLNKMDRSDASAPLCVESVRDKLQVTPLALHQPVLYEGRLVGLIDIITKEEIIWTQGRGQNLTRRKLTEKEDGVRWEAASASHTQLIDDLSSLDDTLADTIIQQESLDNLNSEEIKAAIRRCTLKMEAFPVLCGSSYKNIVSYLPSPLECNSLYGCFEGDLAARAFKVQHDDQRGVLTFLRLYSGEICKGQKIYNLGQDRTEQTGLLYVALADEYKPVERVGAGSIAVVSALKVTS